MCCGGEQATGCGHVVQLDKAVRQDGVRRAPVGTTEQLGLGDGGSDDCANIRGHWLA